MLSDLHHVMILIVETHVFSYLSVLLRVSKGFKHVAGHRNEGRGLPCCIITVLAARVVAAGGFGRRCSRC